MLQREMVNVGREERLSMREADRVGAHPGGKLLLKDRASVSSSRGLYLILSDSPRHLLSV